MFLRNICAFALVVTLCSWCLGQTGTNPSQQPVGGGENAPASTSTPAPGNLPPANTPAAATPSAAPANNGIPAGNNNPTVPADLRNPNLSPRMPAGEARTARAADRDPLLDLPPLPKGKVSLQGGTLLRIDPVRDRIVMTPFQGKRQEIAFDVRTQFTRDGKTIAIRDLKPGTPIYADTIWDGQHVFAKSVRVFTSTHQDQEHGQILAFDSGNGTLRVRDELFPQPVDLKVSSDTVIRKDQSIGSAADLRPGSLVAIKFQPGSHGQAYQIDVLATPGAQFVFSGPVTHIDLLTHVIGISNRSDSVIYDIHFDPSRVKITPDLQEGADVEVNATFDGTQYLANGVTIRSARNSQ